MPAEAELIKSKQTKKKIRKPEVYCNCKCVIKYKKRKEKEQKKPDLSGPDLQNLLMQENV